MNLVGAMLSDLPFDEHELHAILTTAPYRYKVYEIEKRNGRGMRVIAQPSPELKLIQRWIVAKIISKWPIHSAAAAYRPNISPSQHARMHASRRFLLKLDFENFFNSITSCDVRQHVENHSSLAEADTKLLVSALIWRNKRNRDLCLSVGAPSSPALTNSLMYKFDERVGRLCGELDIAYSRYADDLAFSTSHENRIHEAQRIVVETLELLPYPKLRLNTKKTVSTSRRHRRTLVGLVLTPEGKVSLGREKKRMLRAALHRALKGELTVEECSSLRGFLAYAWSVEPNFVNAMVSHYGSDIFRKLDLPFN